MSCQASFELHEKLNCRSDSHNASTMKTLHTKWIWQIIYAKIYTECHVKIYTECHVVTAWLFLH